MTTLEIIHADALTLTREDFSDFDTLIVDPPYSAHVHENATSVGVTGLGGGGMGVHARDLGFDSLTPELRAHVALAATCVRRWSLVFSDFEGAHLWREACEAAGAEYIRTVPWVRWSQPQLSGDRPPTGAEAVLIFHAAGPRRKPIAKHWNGPGSLTHFQRRCMRGKEKHPTEKPLDLLLDLVSWFSDPGQAVLDLCGGSGTTAQAARLLGRDCVCVERDERWALAAQSRVRGALSARDVDRATEWVTATADEAETVPAPTREDGADLRTWERAQRRLADAVRVAEALGLA